jgi:hypothetical protein
VIATPATLDLDPDEALEAEDDGRPFPAAILAGAWDHFGDVGVRTAVPSQTGLWLPERFDRIVVGDRTLVAPMRR